MDGCAEPNGGLRLAPLEAPADVQTCVALMRASDPWLRLGISEDACRRTITHPQREAYAAWQGEVLVGFVVLAFQGPFSGYVQLQACDDSTCVAPADIPFTVSVTVEPGATMGAPGARFSSFDPAIFAEIHSGKPGATAVRFDIFGRTFEINPTGAGFFALLLVAALGGSLLNFTPCVLPVIPLKILSISRAAGHPRRCLQLGLALSAGVVLFWLALGAAMSLISGFTSANQLFQYPLFTIGIGVVIAVMALGMCGAFNIVLPQRVYMVETKQDTLPGAVGFGVMTAVLKLLGSFTCPPPVNRTDEPSPMSGGWRKSTNEVVSL